MIGERALGVLLVASEAGGDRCGRDWPALEEAGQPRRGRLRRTRSCTATCRSRSPSAARAEAELQQANQRKDEFLAMLSHELRNPLAPIRNAVEIMRRVAPPDPKLTWADDVMDRQVRHMTRLVDDLLDVARISQGKIALQPRARST